MCKADRQPQHNQQETNIQSADVEQDWYCNLTNTAKKRNVAVFFYIPFIDSKWRVCLSKSYLKIFLSVSKTVICLVFDTDYITAS